METMQLVQIEKGHLMVSGDLNFQTVMIFLTMSAPFFKENEKMLIDFSSVNKTNSAGLALIFEWIRLGKMHHCQVFFKNIPHELLSIAAISNVSPILKEYIA